MDIQPAITLQTFATVTVSEQARKRIWGEPKPTELIALSFSDLGLSPEWSIQKEVVMERIKKFNLKPCKLETAFQLWLDLHDEEFRNKIWKPGVADSLLVFTDPTQDCGHYVGPTVAILISFSKVDIYTPKVLSIQIWRGLGKMVGGCFYPNWKYVFSK